MRARPLSGWPLVPSTRRTDALDLHAAGHVPWWSRRHVTLRTKLVHVLAETNRHAGHADILREQLDGATGIASGDPNVPETDAASWAAYLGNLEQVAQAAGAEGSWLARATVRSGGRPGARRPRVGAG